MTSPFLLVLGVLADDEDCSLLTFLLDSARFRGSTLLLLLCLFCFSDPVEELLPGTDVLDTSLDGICCTVLLLLFSFLSEPWELLRSVLLRLVPEPVRLILVCSLSGDVLTRPSCCARASFRFRGSVRLAEYLGSTNMAVAVGGFSISTSSAEWDLRCITSTELRLSEAALLVLSTKSELLPRGVVWGLSEGERTDDWSPCWWPLTL